MTEYRSNENVNQPGYFLSWGRGGVGGNQIPPVIDPTVDPKPQRKPYLEAAKGIWGKPIPLFMGAVRITTQPLWFGGMVEDDFGLFADFALVAGSPLDPDFLPTLHQIWADDTLIYDSVTGDRYEGTWTYQFHSGSETQAVDALIADSVGDPDDTPAFLGLSYITFTQFPISPFQNRIPFIGLTLKTHGDNRVPVSDVILAFAQRMGFTAGQVTVNGIDDQCDGMVSIEGTNFRGFLDEIAPLRFDILDGDGVIQITRRPLGDGLTIDRTIPETEVISDGADDPTFDASLIEETMIANEVDIAYPDAALDYQLGHQTKRRPVYPIPVTASRTKREISTPFIITPSEALSVAASELMRGWSDKGSVGLSLGSEHLDIEPGDTLAIANDVGSFHLHVRGNRITSEFRNQLSATLLRISPDVDLDAESGIPTRLIPNPICARLTYIDIDAGGGVHTLGDTTYIYFLTSSAEIYRVNRRDLTDIDYVDLNAVDGDFYGNSTGHAAVIHEGLLYWWGESGSSPPPGKVLKLDLDNFSAAGCTFAPHTAPSAAGQSFLASGGFIVGDYFYVSQYRGAFGTPDHIASPAIARINLLDFATIDGIFFGAGTGLVPDATSIGTCCTDGTYGYFLDGSTNSIVILDLANFTIDGIMLFDVTQEDQADYVWDVTRLTDNMWVSETHLYYFVSDEYDRPRLSRMNLRTRTFDSGIRFSDVSDEADFYPYAGMYDGENHYVLATDDTGAGGQILVCKIGKALTAGRSVSLSVCFDNPGTSFSFLVSGTGLYINPNSGLIHPVTANSGTAIRMPKYVIPWFRT